MSSSALFVLAPRLLACQLLGDFMQVGSCLRFVSTFISGKSFPGCKAEKQITGSFFCEMIWRGVGHVMLWSKLQQLGV